MDEIYWTKARREIQLRIQLRLGELNAVSLSNYQALLQIASAMTADPKKPKPGGPAKDPDRTQLGHGHTSVDDAVASINRMLSFGG